jgi:hypothetical protein
MSLKDKLEIGLKPDAPYRPDNLPDFQANDPECQDASLPGKSATAEQARDECDETPAPRRVKAKLNRRRAEVTRAVAPRKAATVRRASRARALARSRKAGARKTR